MWLTPCSSSTSSARSATSWVTRASAAPPKIMRVLRCPVRPNGRLAIVMQPGYATPEAPASATHLRVRRPAPRTLSQPPRPRWEDPLDRRDFLSKMTALAGAAALPGLEPADLEPWRRLARMLRRPAPVDECDVDH